MNGAKVVVTLVHGTWAPKSAWTRRGSRLRTMLRDALRRAGASEVVFRPFVWSGLNRHGDRRRYGLRFRKRMARRITADPNALHYVMAHSHGGNVALHGIGRSPFLAERMDGLICIATPFLIFEKRRLGLALVPSVLAVSDKVLLRAFDNLVLTIVVAVWIVFHLAAWIIETPIKLWAMWRYPAVNQMAHELGACQNYLSFDACNGGKMFWITVVAASMTWMFFRSGRKIILKRDGPKLASERRQIMSRYAYLQPQARLRSLPVFSQSSSIDEALAGLTGSWWAHRFTAWTGEIISIVSISVAVCIVGTAMYSVNHLLGIVSLFVPGGSGLPLTALSIILITLALAPILRNVGLAAVQIAPGLRIWSPKSNLLVRVKAKRKPDLPRAKPKNLSR